MSIWLWLGFVATIIVLTTLDLRFARRRARDSSPRAAVGWTAAWIAVSLGWGGLLYLLYDTQWAGLGTDFVTLAGVHEPLDGRLAFLRFMNGYILEAALSLDNLFVISLIFAYFRLPRAHQHTVLFCGAFVAIAIRGVWVAAGAGALSAAPWASYILGGMLLLATVKMLTLQTDNPDPDSNPAIRLVRRLYPVSTAQTGRRFFTRLPDQSVGASSGVTGDGTGEGTEAGASETAPRRGRLAMTPLLVALLMVESADGLYALGSVPASLAVARDPLLVFSANILAILTVRSMYHALSPVLHRFTYVKTGLVFVLLYVAVMMLLSQHVVIAPEVTLSVIVGILCVGAAASLATERGTRVMEPPLGYDVEHFARLTVQQARRLIILVIGLTTVALSVPIGILLPGPGGIPIFILGLMILATEFVWARRLLRRAQHEAAEAERRLGVFVKLRQARRWASRRIWGANGV